MIGTVGQKGVTNTVQFTGIPLLWGEPELGRTFPPKGTPQGSRAGVSVTSPPGALAGGGFLTCVIEQTPFQFPDRHNLKRAGALAAARIRPPAQADPVSDAAVRARMIPARASLILSTGTGAYPDSLPLQLLLLGFQHCWERDSLPKAACTAPQGLILPTPVP